MRVALIGNTCNGNFAIMRYFRELGVDAHLLIYANEGVSDSNPQYSPEWDTWEIEKWKDYIHRLPISNGIESLIGRPDLLKLPPSRKVLEEIFSGYDCYIGSGITPGIFYRIKKKLTIFYPYSSGVEWVGEDEFVRKLENYNFEYLFRLLVRRMQVGGIRNSKFCLNAMLDSTQDVLTKYNISSERLSIPGYYNLEDEKSYQNDALINNLLRALTESNLTIFSHARHYWVFDELTHTKEGFSAISKHNDWLLLGFHKFIKKNPESRAKLILVDWGLHASSSKELCASLNIESSVIWLPLLKRRQTSIIMSYCDIGVGEFEIQKGKTLSFTGWEVLACGKPLLQSFNFSSKEYQSLFGHHPPKILDVKSKQDIYDHLSEMYFNKEYMLEVGDFNRKWFNKYHGISLAKKWLSVLDKSC
jgi:hypothetical protein